MGRARQSAQPGRRRSGRIGTVDVPAYHSPAPAAWTTVRATGPRRRTPPRSHERDGHPVVSPLVVARKCARPSIGAHGLQLVMLPRCGRSQVCIGDLVDLPASVAEGGTRRARPGAPASSERYLSATARAARRSPARISSLAPARVLRFCGLGCGRGRHTRSRAAADRSRNCSQPSPAGLPIVST